MRTALLLTAAVLLVGQASGVGSLAATQANPGSPTSSPSSPESVRSALKDAAQLLTERAKKLDSNDPQSAALLRKVASQLVPVETASLQPGVSTRPSASRRGLITVEEGIGYDAVVIGASVDQILALLGSPDKRTDSPQTWLQYRRKLAIDIIFPRGKAAEIRFSPGFKGRLAGGPSIATPMQQVLRAYGEPVRTQKASRSENLFEDRVLYELPGAWKIQYADSGVLFWFDKSRKVSQFVVFAKRGTNRPSANTEIQSSESGSREGLEADTKKDRITLVAPYPVSYPGTPRDKISVQYAVIEIAKQVDLGYDWNTSFKNTDPACRQWITPNFRDVSFSNAMSMILDPVGLRYEVRDEKVVLMRK